MKLTKEQIFIKELADSNYTPVIIERMINKRFPELFENKVEVGKWYSDLGQLFYCTKIKGNDVHGYGFGWNKTWCDDDCWELKNPTLATVNM